VCVCVCESVCVYIIVFLKKSFKYFLLPSFYVYRYSQQHISSSHLAFLCGRTNLTNVTQTFLLFVAMVTMLSWTSLQENFCVRSIFTWEYWSWVKWELIFQGMILLPNCPPRRLDQFTALQLCPWPLPQASPFVRLKSGGYKLEEAWSLDDPKNVGLQNGYWHLPCMNWLCINYTLSSCELKLLFLEDLISWFQNLLRRDSSQWHGSGVGIDIYTNASEQKPRK
jgi:hypothetical protein